MMQKAAAYRPSKKGGAMGDRDPAWRKTLESDRGTDPRNRAIGRRHRLRGGETGMTDVYLEVTYREGRPWVAYLYLPREKREKSYRSAECWR